MTKFNGSINYPVLANATMESTQVLSLLRMENGFGKDGKGAHLSSEGEWAGVPYGDIPYIRDAAKSVRSYRPDEMSNILIFSDNEIIGKKVAMYLMRQKLTDLMRVASENKTDASLIGPARVKYDKATNTWSLVSYEMESAESDADEGWSIQVTDEDVIQAMDEMEEEGWYDDDADDDEYYDEEADDDEAEVEEAESEATSNGNVQTAVNIDLSELGIDMGMMQVGISNPYYECLNKLTMTKERDVVICGFKGDHLDVKLDGVIPLKTGRKALVVPYDNIGKPWTFGLMMNHNYVPIYINKVNDSYFADVLVGELEKAGLHLDAKPIAAVSFIRNKVCTDSSRFSEEVIRWVVSQAKRRIGEASNDIQLKELLPHCDVEEPAQEKLRKMIGLDDGIREILKERVALAAKLEENPSLADIHTSMIFAGNPGTGKTTCAKLIAQSLIENGLCASGLIIATRSDLVGQYIGQTAPKVRKLFEQARHGVLFIDEAGFFLNTNAGGYINEAIKEIVRYMEEYPDVTVIFGMYRSEVDAFMKLDDGLKSRISEVVIFRDYTEDEFCRIFKKMVAKNGYRLQQGSSSLVKQYYLRIKKSSGFGNARDARKLAEAAVKAHVVNDYDGVCKDKKTITPKELKKAMLKFSPVTEPESRRVIGFSGYVESAAQ